MARIEDSVLDRFDRAYFIGIGGIGMSALARYFHAKGWLVAGYDKTPSPLTHDLDSEGIPVHYEDLGESIPEPYKDEERSLIVYTPAIPAELGELKFFQRSRARLYKRSEVLGIITRISKGLGVAGTHGKTTTSSMLAYLLSRSRTGCNAFLGGIATNFGTNLVLHPTSPYTVVEADEFDRSFLQLDPYCSIITSDDPDHLDIYGNANYFREGFKAYAALFHPEGCLVQRYGLNLQSSASVITYGINEEQADYSGYNLRFIQGSFLFDVRTPDGVMQDIELGIPGMHNAENAVACIALSNFLGIGESTIRDGLKTFRGVKRRFEYVIRTPELVYIDDYAHHPTEIKALVSSVRQLYPDKKIIGVFQPHLFSRTRDFFEGFAKELSALDEVILMPIYPAREQPIPGVSSQKLLDALTNETKNLLEPAEVIHALGERKEGVFLTIGAGDIDRIVEPLKKSLLS